MQDDRSHAIDSAAIRIMKTRKRMEWSQLMTEVLTQMTLFKPQPPQVKKRIEKLIDNGYIERDAEDKSILNYVA